MASAPVPPPLSAASSPLSRSASVASDSRSIWRRPRSFRLACPPRLLTAATSRDARGAALATSNCWVPRSAAGEWCEDLLGRRIGKVRSLLAAIGKFPDAQGAFCLLRSCSGWSKVLYSCRTVPPDAQAAGLRTADADFRAALAHLIGRPLSEDDWRLSSLCIAAGGLGARCASEHAPAAYVASFSACRDTCCVLWPAFDPV